MLQGGCHAEMRLVTFSEQGIERIGIQLDTGILDLSRVSSDLPGDMIAFLTLGEAALSQAREALAPQDSWLIDER